MSWTLCGASPQCRVTADAVATPRLAAYPSHGPGQGPDRSDEDGEVHRATAGQDGVDGDEAAGRLTESGREGGHDFVGIDIAEGVEHGIDPLAGGRHHRKPVAPPTGLVDVSDGL